MVILPYRWVRLPPPTQVQVGHFTLQVGSGTGGSVYPPPTFPTQVQVGHFTLQVGQINPPPLTQTQVQVGHFTLQVGPFTHLTPLPDTGTGGSFYPTGGSFNPPSRLRYRWVSLPYRWVLLPTFPTQVQVGHFTLQVGRFTHLPDTSTGTGGSFCLPPSRLRYRWVSLPYRWVLLPTFPTQVQMGHFAYHLSSTSTCMSFPSPTPYSKTCGSFNPSQNR